jgi:enoyl-CoA hydratase
MVVGTDGSVQSRRAGHRLGMTTPTVRVEVDAPIAKVVLDRPDVLNAFTPAMLVELGDAMASLAADESVHVVVLTGAGRAFSAGVDLKALGTRLLDGGRVGDALDVPARRVASLITTMPKVVLASVNGFCFTGALELVLACDLVVVAEEAVLGDTHAKYGLRPSWGMSQRLVHSVGIGRARALSYTAATFSGVDAAAWGLATEAVPRARLDEVVDSLARSIAAHSPGAIAACKDLYRRALEGGLTDGLTYEAETDYVIADTEARIAAFR